MRHKKHTELDGKQKPSKTMDNLPHYYIVTSTQQNSRLVRNLKKQISYFAKKHHS